MSDYSEMDEAKDTKSQQEDLDMAKIQSSMQGLREQQDRELQEDLGKLENRPKPPWIQDREQDREISVPPLSNEVKSKIHEIQGLPIEQRRQAVADFYNTKAGRQTGELNGGVMTDGKGVFIRDADGNQYDILYEEDAAQKR